MSTTTRTTRAASRSWQNYHLRADAVNGVLARLSGGAATELPWDDDLAEVFIDPDDLLEALHAVWTRRLLARVDLELELGEGTPRQSVETAWRATAKTLPALRSLLDRYADSEVAHRCVAGEHRLIAVAAGLAGLSDPRHRSARLGAELVASFGHVVVRTHRARSSHRLGRLLGCRHASQAA